MTAFLQTKRRAQRVVRLYREEHERSGSSIAAARYVARLVRQKVPIALRQVRSVLQHKAALRDIMAARTRIGNDKPFLGVKITGGIGDMLVIARFLRDLSAFCGGLNFDIFTTAPGRAQWIFGGLDGFRACQDELLFEFTAPAYDVMARINQFVCFDDHPVQWSKLNRHAGLVRAVRNAIQFRPKVEPLIQHHPYLDGYLGQTAFYANRTRADFLHHMAGVPYGGDRLEVDVAAGQPQRYGLTPKRYITVHNGYDPGFVVTGARATKCYPRFDTVIALLKQSLPDMQFVQIGVSTSIPLREADLNLLNVTSMQEAAGLISEAALHIDNEGGLVHLARCLGTDSCVVFGPTPAAYFGYEDNINITSSYCGGCWWVNETWMSHCPRGHEDARCMMEIDPRNVATAVERHLAQHPERLRQVETKQSALC